MIVDFHSHTLESDGSLAPADLVRRMRDRGVRVFSITDHDTTRAYANLAVDFATLVPGIEINTSWNDNEVHVLGYNVPLAADSLLGRTIDANRGFRRERLARMIAQVNAAGYPLDEAEVFAESAGSDALGRPHIARALVRTGQIKDIETAFRELLGRGKPGYVASNYITPVRAVEVILASGGVPVLAHPGRLTDLAIIDELVAAGLVGLEVFYPAHDASMRSHFRAIAHAHGLLMTAGSDFHDPGIHTRGVGMEVDDLDIAPFLERIGASAVLSPPAR
jgi:predicted metal-dependent phosphoesterase TrpH